MDPSTANAKRKEKKNPSQTKQKEPPKPMKHLCNRIMVYYV